MHTSAETTNVVYPTASPAPALVLFANGSPPRPLPDDDVSVASAVVETVDAARLVGSSPASTSDVVCEAVPASTDVDLVTTVNVPVASFSWVFEAAAAAVEVTSWSSVELLTLAHITVSRYPFKARPSSVLSSTVTPLHFDMMTSCTSLMELRHSVEHSCLPLKSLGVQSVSGVLYALWQDLEVTSSGILEKVVRVYVAEAYPAAKMR